MADSDLFAEYCREAAKLKHIHPEILSENKVTVQILGF